MKTKEEIKKDLKFLKEMHRYSQNLLEGENDEEKLIMINQMIEDWIYELEELTKTEL